MKTFTVQKARKIAGSATNKMNDDEIQELISQFYALAEILANTISDRFQKEN